MITAQEYYEELSKNPPIPSGDIAVDTLLRGGFIPGPVYLLYGPSSLLTHILLRTAVNALSPQTDGGAAVSQIAYIDGENTFNPYFLSKYAISKQMDPNFVLNHILVSRVFTWNQMVEVVEEKVAALEHVDLILISGLTSMFEENFEAIPHQMPSHAKGSAFPPKQKVNWNTFQDLNRMINGLKRIIERSNPLIIMTGPINSHSRVRPVGGQILTHFGGVLLEIDDQERFLDYTLQQHPCLPYQKERIWRTVLQQEKSQLKRSLLRDPHNLTLDAFFQKSK